LSEVFKNTSIAITTFILLTALIAGAFSHKNHGGVEVDGYLVDVQPQVFTAGRTSDFFVLIDYKSNETEVPGLNVETKIKAVGGDGFKTASCREVAAGQYICAHNFEGAGEYVIVVSFDSLSATFPVTVKAADSGAASAPLTYLMIVVGGGFLAILSMKVLNGYRFKKKQQAL